jgi:hypothetical protein
VDAEKAGINNAPLVTLDPVLSMFGGKTKRLLELTVLINFETEEGTEHHHCINMSYTSDAMQTFHQDSLQCTSNLIDEIKSASTCPVMSFISIHLLNRVHGCPPVDKGCPSFFILP